MTFDFWFCMGLGEAGGGGGLMMVGYACQMCWRGSPPPLPVSDASHYCPMYVSSSSYEWWWWVGWWGGWCVPGLFFFPRLSSWSQRRGKQGSLFWWWFISGGGREEIALERGLCLVKKPVTEQLHVCLTWYRELLFPWPCFIPHLLEHCSALLPCYCPLHGHTPHTHTG